MKRIVFEEYDTVGESRGVRWFDADKAEKFNEDTYWDGNNHISKATGSQWEHETLYRTASGRFLVLSASQWQGTRDSWREIQKTEAVSWLMQNGHEEEAERISAEAVAALEA